MKESEVLALCESVCPKFGIDPVFLLALAKQESGYDETEARPENGFYRRYVRPMSFPTSTEILFSASYGLTQIMGEVLWELGYFSENSGSIAGLIDRYMASPDLHIAYACRFLDRARKLGKSIRDVLRRYNPRDVYPDEVMEKYEALCRKFDRTPLDNPL